MNKHTSSVVIGNEEFKAVGALDNQIYRQLAIKTISKMPFDQLYSLFEFSKINPRDENASSASKGGSAEKYFDLLHNNQTEYTAVLLINE